tara:strand:- start:7 stop:357 length:351 start_codon:yes stop_codon:yes gene_type:complete
MDLLNKSDEEILKIAAPLWENLINCSNTQDYFGFTRDFSARMLFGANEIELAKQWSNNEVITNLKQENDFLGCIRRDEHVTVLFKQKSTITNGDYLGRLVLGVEDGEIKIFGATIF